MGGLRAAVTPLRPAAAQRTPQQRRHAWPRHGAPLPPLRVAPPGCASARRAQARGRAAPPRAGAEEPPEDAGAASDDTASSFANELKRRRIQDRPDEDLLARLSGAPPKRPASAPPRWASDARPTPDQLAKSRALSGEGLEGLIPRATELLRLGFGFFLPFLPFMVAFSVLFTITFYVFGADFLHGGNYYALPAGTESTGANAAADMARPAPVQRRAPAYIPPEALLAEPTVDRMVPFVAPQQQ